MKIYPDPGAGTTLNNGFGIYAYTGCEWMYLGDSYEPVDPGDAIEEVLVYGIEPHNTPVDLDLSDLWIPGEEDENTWFYWDYDFWDWMEVEYTPPPSPESQTATNILANSNVTPATVHVSQVSDNATAAQNLQDTANGEPAHTSCYGNAPCTTVTLSLSLLNGIETLAQNFTFSISEIAGGSHAVNSSHYSGIAMDVNYVNTKHADTDVMTDSEIIAFREAAYAAGASLVLDPLNEPVHHYNHFHIQC